MNIYELKMKITDPNNKMKQNYLIWLCLKYSEENKKSISSIGIGWFDDYKFLFNSKLFGAFSHKLINTLNHNFESNGFKAIKINSEIKKKACEIYSIKHLPDPKGWVLRSCDGFTRFTTENEILRMKSIGSKKKSPKKMKSMETSSNYDSSICSKTQIKITNDFNCKKDNDDNISKNGIENNNYEIEANIDDIWQYNPIKNELISPIDISFLEKDEFLNDESSIFNSFDYFEQYNSYHTYDDL